MIDVAKFTHLTRLVEDCAHTTRGGLMLTSFNCRGVLRSSRARTYVRSPGSGVT